MGITDTQPHQHAKQGNATQELPHPLHIIPISQSVTLASPFTSCKHVFTLTDCT